MLTTFRYAFDYAKFISRVMFAKLKRMLENIPYEFMLEPNEVAGDHIEKFPTKVVIFCNVIHDSPIFKLVSSFLLDFIYLFIVKGSTWLVRYMFGQHDMYFTILYN